MNVEYVTPEAGNCICGYPSWTLVDGKPMHPCCAANGPNCEPCRISRDANKRKGGLGCPTDLPRSSTS